MSTPLSQSLPPPSSLPTSDKKSIPSSITPPPVIKILGIVFLFSMLSAILIIVCLNRWYPASKEKQSKSKSNYKNVLEAVFTGLVGKENVRYTGSIGEIRLAETSQHQIKLIPTYHALKETVDHFLAQKKASPNDYYVVIDGEPNPIPRQNIDLVITSKKNTHPNDIYIPYWVMMLQEHQKNIEDLLEPAVPNKTSLDEWMRRKFIAFCYSNKNTTRYRGTANRAQFYQILSKKLSMRVHNLGTQSKNIKDIIIDNSYQTKLASSGDWDNHILYKQFKFTVAFENQELEGYVTEKLANPFFAGCIPIYLGAKDVKEHFNPDAMINVNDYKNFEDCIDDIIKLSTDIPRLTKILGAIPLISDQYLGLLKSKGSDIHKKIAKTSLGYLLPPIKINSYRTHFITFSPSIPKLPMKHLSNIGNTNKIMEQATKSKCFDDIISLNYESLPYEFLDKHQSFLETNKNQNYGFGIWKPWLLKHYLDTVVDGDICCFGSVGFQFNNIVIKRLPKLFELLRNKYQNYNTNNGKDKENANDEDNEKEQEEEEEEKQKQEKKKEDTNNILPISLVQIKPSIGAFKSQHGDRLRLHHSTKRDTIWNSILTMDPVYQERRKQAKEKQETTKKNQMELNKKEPATTLITTTTTTAATQTCTPYRPTVKQNQTYTSLVECVHMSTDFIMVLKTPETIAFLEKWIDLCNDYRNLQSYIPQPDKEHVLFQKHHDHESIFNCLFHLSNQIVF